MKCDKTQEIPAYLKGEVAEAEREALRLHFDQCSSCTQDLAKFDKVLKALGRMETVDPSPGFKWRVREAFLRAHPEFLELPKPQPVSWWQSFRESFASVPAWALSIAAHVLLLTVAAALFLMPKSPEDQFVEHSVHAKPREPAGDPPEFRGAGARPPRIDRISGDVTPDAPDVDYTRSPKRGSEPIVAVRRPRPNPNRERLDHSAWRERITRDRRLLAFFSGRASESQRKTIREAFGGSGTEEAINAGLDWLAREQQSDHSWKGPSVRGKDGGRYTYSTGLTGLALLAFLAEGHAGRTGPYAMTVRHGLEFLLNQQRASGLIGDETGNYMYDHAIAALALLEAAMMTRDDALDTAASSAVSFTLRAQNETGGWGYTARSPDNDTSVCGWQILLLRLAKLNGNQGVIPALMQAYKRIQLSTDHEGKVGYRRMLQFPNGYRALTAVGMLCHQMATHTPDPGVLEKQASVLLEQSPILGTQEINFGLNDLYFAYFGSLAMLQYDGGDTWLKWYSPLRDKLVKTQLQDGSWPSHFDRWATYGGQVYTTAAALLVLETPVRYPRLAE